MKHEPSLREFRRLDARRRAAGLTLREWAALADISESLIYKLSQQKGKIMGELAEIKLTRALDALPARVTEAETTTP